MLLLSSTSSALTSKPKPKPVSALVDTTNGAPAVQLRDQSILVQGVPEENQVSEKDEQIKRFEELINKKQYNEIAELGKKMDDEELLKCLCQVVTSLDHFKGLYEYLKQREMVPGFLAHGGMVLVREVTIETDLLETEGFGGCNSIYDAITLSLNEDCHERVAGLLEAAQERPSWKDEFDLFVGGFFVSYPPEKVSMPLKRFITLHGEEFSKKHPAIFGTVCERLVWRSKCQLNNLASQKLLVALVGQPSLLTPVAFAKGFLDVAGGTGQTDFIKYGYKEAIEEGLKEKYRGGGEGLWTVMVRKYPNQFSGEYPITNKARSLALKDFKPTKQDLEEAWAKRNAPNLRMKLEMLVSNLLPTVLLGIVSEYAVTWIALSWSPPQSQLRPQVSEQVSEKFKALMSEKRYVEIVELGSSMEKDVLAKHLYPLMTTTEHCMYLNGYLDSRDMIPNFLILGEMGIVRKAILEFENMDSDYYISHDHICDAITLSIKEHRDGHAISLLRIERERHATADEQCKLTRKTPQFEVLLIDFSRRFIEKGDTASFKRFLTINKGELDEGWPNIFEIMCQGMVSRLMIRLHHPRRRNY